MQSSIFVYFLQENLVITKPTDMSCFIGSPNVELHISEPELIDVPSLFRLRATVVLAE